MQTMLRGTCAGAVGGLVATAPMTLFMEAVRSALPPSERSPIPPREITERATARAGVRGELTDGERESLSMAAHFAFGAGAGAAYGVLAHALDPPPIVGGVAFGLAVWAGSYLGWLPATGLYTAATREPAGRNLMIVGAHVIWGAALGLVADALGGTTSSRSQERRETT